MEYRKNLTADFLRKIIEYDPETGIFRWKMNRPPRAKKGQEAGYVRPDGYRSIGINGETWHAHRLAYLYMTGHWPPHQIDHQFGHRDDNRWEEIRPSSHAANLHNRGAQRNSKSQIKGVHKRKDCNRWAAFIAVNTKTIYLGLFKTQDEAAEAYRSAATKHHGDFANIG